MPTFGFWSADPAASGRAMAAGCGLATVEKFFAPDPEAIATAKANVRLALD
jgi:hypothetical protein